VNGAYCFMLDWHALESDSQTKTGGVLDVGGGGLIIWTTKEGV